MVSQSDYCLKLPEYYGQVHLRGFNLLLPADPKYLVDIFKSQDIDVVWKELVQ